MLSERVITRILGQRSLASLLFGNGEDGFLFGNFSELDELYTLVPGFGVAVAADNDPVGAALDDHGWGASSYSAIMSAQSELYPDGGMTDASTGWTYTNAAGTIVSGALRLTSTAVGVASRSGYKTLAGLTVGRTYRVSGDVVGTGGTAGASATIRLQALTTAGAAVQDSEVTTGAGTRSLIFVATATSHRIQVRFDGGGGDTTTYVDFDNLSVKQVPGNHGLQATSGARPLWRANSGKPYLQFDGSDDLLSTGLSASSTAWTLAVAFSNTSGIANAISIGVTSVGTNQRLALGTVSGTLTGGWGATSTASTIIGGSITLGQGYVGLLRGNGSLVELWLDGASVYSGAASGSPSGTTAALNLGSYAGGAFFNGKLSAALAVNRYVSDAEIARITSDFRRTL